MENSNLLQKTSCGLSLILFLTTAAGHAQSYCAASGTLCDNHISNASVTSAQGGFNNNTGCETGNYGNYTSLVASLVVNTAYQASTTSNQAGYFCGQVSVWIDWNNNFLFTDVGENVFTAGTAGGWQNVPVPYSITPPNGTTPGFKRMRIRTGSNCTGTLVPCGNTPIGEVEDYTINVLACTPAPATPGTITGFNSVCANASATYSISSVATATSYTWTVPSGSTINSGQGTTSLTVTFGATSGNITVTATNSCGTSAPSTKTVTVNSNPTANAGSDLTICSGSSATLSASGGTTYSWVPSTGLSSPNISNPVASPVSNTTYTVTVTNASGCSAKDAMIVNVHPPVNASAGSDVTVCSGNNTTLNATGGTNYLWSTGETDATITVFPAASATYTLFVSDANGCSGMDEVMVTVNPIAMADAGSDVSICSSDSTILNGTGNGTYLWSPSTGLSDPTIPNPVATPASTTTYTLTVTNDCGSASDSVTITITTTPSVDVGIDDTICLGDSLQLIASGSGTFAWSPPTGLSCTNCPNPMANPTATTTYSVTITTSCGPASDDITVTVDSCGVVGISSVTTTPNIIISPNPTTGIFKVENFGFKIQSRWLSGLEIYNVMGEKIFTSPLAPLSHGRGDRGEVIDLSSRPAGIYFVKVVSGNEYFVCKIIKQ